jgi:hypothetical protein
MHELEKYEFYEEASRKITTWGAYMSMRVRLVYTVFLKLRITLG